MADTRFMRGARPSPRYKLAAAIPFRALMAPAPQFAVVPDRLDMWGNDQYGDCVSAEEAFAKAWWSTFCGLPELCPTAAEVIAFARRYGYLNGADLVEVMDTMIRYGMAVGGKNYTDGSYQSVDYSNQLVLQAALDATDGSGGPVKIAIDADALPSGAGNQSGWYSTSGARYGNTDHCVAISGYGRADFLFDQLKLKLPSGLSPSTPAYHLYTWKTIGVVTHDWLLGTCVEAWVRNPTTPGQSPAPPPPPSPPPPPPPGPSPVTLYAIAPPQTVRVPFLGGNVTIPGGAYPIGPKPGEHAGGVPEAAPPPGAAVKWPGLFVVLADLSAVLDAYRSNDLVALRAAVLKLVADFGITLPF